MIKFYQNQWTKLKNEACSGGSPLYFDIHSSLVNVYWYTPQSAG